MLSWLKKLTGTEEEKARKKYQPTVQRINELEESYQQLTTAQLREKTDEFRQSLDEGATLDDILPDAFATVREASRRTIGMRHYDVQLIGGIVLHQGRIAEMKTGEGKTLVATLPLYLNALSGEGVHLITVNDYLARRDAGWMGPVYTLLGLSLGFIGHDFSALFDPEYVDVTGTLDDERLVHWRPCTRREAYDADITYGTNNEFGFDYLRDNMVNRFDDMVQGNHNYAIVDEVDNILIDEARTPLIISGPARQSSSQYARFAQIVHPLRVSMNFKGEPKREHPLSPDDVKKEKKEKDKNKEPDGDVLIDLKSRSALLTEDGLARIEAQIEELEEGESVYDPRHSDLTHYLENALKARFIYERDKDYVVQEGEVVIVDEFTGRLMPGRRWSDGLHQSVEAKEGVDVRRESVTYATITFQNYFRMYNKLSGMTGTAATEKEEFGKIYDLEVTVIPTNKLCVRDDLPDQIYRNEDAKFGAVINDIKERALDGQPVLVGTTAVETSERLSERIERDLRDYLKDGSIRLHVLNAKQNADEAAIVAQAGQSGSVTIATNMAGRGTDILLGGNPEALAARHLRDTGIDRKQLEELSQHMFGAQKVQKSTIDAIIERSEGKLAPDLVSALEALHQELERDLKHLEQKGEHLFLVDKLLGAVSPSLFEQKRELVRSVLQNNIPRARRMVQYIDELGEEKIAEIQHMYHDYHEYRANPRERPALLAGKLFDRIYTARAKLVQLTLHGDLDRARQLVEETPGLKPEYVDDILRIQRECEENHERIKSFGGLHVVGTERHEARRIDNQLRGRSGRQGDPGSSRFYLSLTDELMKRFGRMDALKGVMEKLGVEEDMPIEHPLINKSIEGAQSRVEGYNFDIRKHTFDYDTVMNKQREVVYDRRRRILQEANEQNRMERLLHRYFKPDQMLQEIREEVGATVDLEEERARQRVLRLLPDVPFDLAALRAAHTNDEKIYALLEPMVKQQQQASFNLLLDDLADMLDLPDNIEAELRERNYEEARNLMNDLWRDQHDGDLEDRIKDLFGKEFDDMIQRYLVNYESWLRDQISQTIADATNPATDEVSLSVVRRRLRGILPEIDQFVHESDEGTSDELEGLSADRLQSRLEGLIAANHNDGHNLTLLVREIVSMVPFLPDHQNLVIPNLSATAREQARDQYSKNYTSTLTVITASLPESEQERLREETVSFIHEQVQPLLESTTISTEQRDQVVSELMNYSTELLGAVIAVLDIDAVHTMLDDLLDRAFDRWRTDLGVKPLDNFQRSLMLQTIDREWQQYLTAMDDMRQGIGLQAIGQRDPLIQYQTLGYRMFNELLENIDRTVVKSFFQQLPNYHRHMEQYRQEQEARAKAAQSGYEVISGGKAGARRTGGGTVRREGAKVGPNDPCPCGSGKKYKYCHGRRGSDLHVVRGREGELVESVVGGNSGNVSAGQVAAAQHTPRGRSAPPPPSAPVAQQQPGRGTSQQGSSKKKKKKKR